MTRPKLFSFDVFGTVLDWRRGLSDDLSAAGRPLAGGEFDRVVDAQGALEGGPYRTYADIVAQSLVDVIGLDAAAAGRIGAGAGAWPLYADSADALRRLRKLAPCVAMTNSDRAHRAAIEAQLGFALDGWICAEDVGAYKPSMRVWDRAAEVTGTPKDAAWWHVSAYADYDLKTARSAGLTCVFVRRPHARVGAADLEVDDLAALADMLREPRTSTA
jgi:2-haloalkanoic acid dehalogenase type II